MDRKAFLPPHPETRAMIALVVALVIIGFVWAVSQEKTQLSEEAYYRTVGGPNPRPVRVEQSASFWTFAYRCLVVGLLSGIFVRLRRICKGLPSR